MWCLIIFSTNIQEEQEMGVQDLPGEAEPEEGVLLRIRSRVQA
jgi:hypothetical protein